MDSYMHATASPHVTRSISTSSTLSSSTPPKLLQPYPPSNKDFECKELHTADGTYPLRHEFFLSTCQPQFSQGTTCVLVNAKQQQGLTVQKVGTAASSSTTSSMSEQLLGMTPVTEQPGADSSDDDTFDSNGGGIYFEAKKSAALPIPNSNNRNKQQTVASSSSSSVERGILPVSTTITSSNSTNAINTTTGNGSITPRTNGLVSGGITPITSTPQIPQQQDVTSHQQQYQQPPQTTVTAPEASTSTSIGGSSSVGSLSSLFSRNSLRHHHHYHYHPKKPKNSLIKTNSSFVLRMTVHEQISKILASRNIGDSYLFYNVGMSFIWMEGNQKVKECLSKITFTKAYPTCHDVNKTTNTGEHMDVIIGFSTGDCMWYDPISSKYARLNKGGIVNTSAATCVKWVPGSEELFLISFGDGSILLMDKERDDQAFTPASPASWAEQQFQATKPRKSAKYNPVSHWKVADKSITAFEFSPDGSNVAIVCSDGTLRIVDYTTERLCDVYAGYFGKLNCISWSPDGRYILTGGQDDLVTIWSLHEQKIVARCQGHKSWVTAVAFDPWRCDEKVYRFGSVGEDCRMILWDFSFSALHRPKHKFRHSTSTPHSPIKDMPKSPKSPTFLPSATNHHPFHHHQQQQQHNSQHNPNNNVSPSATISRSKSKLSRFRRRTSRSANIFSDHDDEDDDTMYSTTATAHDHQHHQALHLRMATVHPILNKDQVPYLQPVMSQTVHADPCSFISFHKDCIVTADRRGKVRTWGRP
ncbi:WD40-repeat-containing domain protein [Circinella umbellata]|nr:WD40-repeat-containing domain protein [Circinella umbellata]